MPSQQGARKCDTSDLSMHPNVLFLCFFDKHFLHLNEKKCQIVVFFLGTGMYHADPHQHANVND